jgi:hypothetical protein
MKRTATSRLRDFVNRETQMRTFQELLQGNDKGVMAVWGDGGSGKSSLVTRMMAEVTNADARLAFVEWTDEWKYDYLDVMRSVRDQLSPEHFNAFSDLLNYYTAPGHKLTLAIEGGSHIKILEGGTVAQSGIGMIAGVIVQDLKYVAPRPDLDISPTERMTRLTTAFLLGLSQASSACRAVVFFDAAEKMPADTREWFWQRIMNAIDENLLPNVRFVVSGRNRPELSREISLLIAEVQVGPLDIVHVEEYLDRRGIPAAHRSELARMVVAAVGSNPLQIATAVDSFLHLHVR